MILFKKVEWIWVGFFLRTLVLPGTKNDPKVFRWSSKIDHHGLFFMRQIGLKALRDSRRRRGASHMARRLCVVCRAVQAVNGQPWPSFQPDLWSQVSTRVSSHCALHVIREGTKDFFFH